MGKEAVASNYYKDNLPHLIDELKRVVISLLPIISQPLSEDLADDKLFSALRGKRQAAEDYRYYLRLIEELENEFNGVEIEDNNIGKKDFVKERAAARTKQA